MRCSSNTHTLALAYSRITSLSAYRIIGWVASYSGGGGGGGSGVEGGGGLAGGEDKAAMISRLLHTSVYSAGDGRLDSGAGTEDSLVASRTGEALRWVQSACEEDGG